jgi:dTDP-glucose 4,6-dehydratase
MDKVSTLFVTGGAGFIGSCFVRLVLEELPRARVTNFDALTYAGNLDNLKEVEDERHRFVRGDICDPAAVLASLEEGTDYLVNFAAESHVDRSIHSAAEFVRTNVLGTQVLLDAARERGVGRFVQVSTDEVMGSLPERDDAFFTEESPFAPNSPYSASKAAAEHLCRAAHHTHGMDAVVTRCGNNYGPRQFPEKFLPLLLANASRDEPVPVYGDGRNVRDWIYVEDHCRAILAALLKGKAGEVYNVGARNVRDWIYVEDHCRAVLAATLGGKSGGVYNVGARNERRNVEVAESVLEALGKPRSLIRFVKDRPGHDRRYAIDPARAERELGWRPRETWESGLRKTIGWYRDNAEWVERARSGEYRDYYRKQYGDGVAGGE